MYVATLPFFPLVKQVYDIEKVKPTEQIMMQLYPEIYACVGCNACTKSCTQGLNVMQYIAYAQRGEFDKCAEESFDCVMCGVCSSRCPAGISHPQVAMLARRLNGKYLAPKSEHLENRVREIENGTFDELMEALMVNLHRNCRSCTTTGILKIRGQRRIMYSKEFRESLNAVEAAREANIALEPARMTAEEKEKLLKQYHPDYKTSEFAVLKVGANSGEEVPHELCEMLQAHSRINPCEIDLEKIDYDVDVLVIGGGGAGASAAIEAHNAGANTMIVTKLRIGDANTMMAEGGIQAADKPNDSPAIHFLDAYGGGHFAAKRELLQKLVCDAPGAIQWLNELGVEFDKAPDGTMITTHGGGTSRKRMHAAKDYSGAEIMRTLRDEVLNLGIPVVDFTSAIELILDENGNAAGAVLLNMETGENACCACKNRDYCNGRCRQNALSGIPDFQSLRCNG